MPKEVTIRPMPTTEDLARSIQSLDATLSEVLVLLYHVVQANHSLVESLREPQRPVTVPAAARLAELRHLYPVLTERTMGQ